MDYVTLPGTELRVSRVCLGTWQLAGSVENGTSDITFGSVTQEDAQAIVAAALETGINFFDCAEMYGGGQAEKTLGAALEALGARDRVVIATKFGVHKPLWETDDPYGEAKVYDGDAVRQALDASLARLRTDRVELYQVPVSYTHLTLPTIYSV